LQHPSELNNVVFWELVFYLVLSKI